MLSQCSVIFIWGHHLHFLTLRARRAMVELERKRGLAPFLSELTLGEGDAAAADLDIDLAPLLHCFYKQKR